MTGKTLTLAAIVGSLLIGTSATAVLAREETGRGPGGAGMFVHMLQEFDTNKDGKISRDEAASARDGMFAAVDADKDGNLTPGEFRKHREAMRTARQAEMQANAQGQGQGQQDGLDPKTGERQPGGGKQFGWGWGDNAPRGWHGSHHGSGRGGDDNDGPRQGKHHAMRDGDRGPGMGPNGPRGERMGGMGPRGMMRMADADENGQISKAEATTLSDKMFTRMDTDKDGFISADDLPKRGFWKL